MVCVTGNTTVSDAEADRLVNTALLFHSIELSHQEIGGQIRDLRGLRNSGVAVLQIKAIRDSIGGMVKQVEAFERLIMEGA